MSKHDKKEDAPKLMPRMTLEQRTLLFATLLSNRFLFTIAQTRLKPEHLDKPEEQHLLLIWLTALDVANKYEVDMLFQDRSQVWNVMDTEGKAMFEALPGRFPLEIYDSIFGHEPPGFLKWLYNCKPEEFSHDYGVKLLGHFLRERAVHDAMQNMASDVSSGVITNFGQVVEKLVTTEQDITLLGVDPVMSAAPEDWVLKPSRPKPTGVGFVDTLLRGGHRAPETYLLLGATGAGKTTLGQQLAYSIAECEQMWAADPTSHPGGDNSLGENYEMGHVYIFHYEMSEDDFRIKLWSCASHVALEEKLKLLGLPHPETKEPITLSTSATLTPAEKALTEEAIKNGFASQADMGEYERLERAKKTMRINLWQIDCSGNLRHPTLGTGFVQEVANILTNEQRKGRKIAAVFIDYLDAMVKLHEPNQEKAYALLDNVGRLFERKIAIPFNTPVWVMQQLSGQANQRTAATKQHYSDAKGNKSTANSFWFSLAIGTPDEKSKARYLTVSKARRTDLGVPPILQIDGDFNRLKDVSKLYEFDGRGRVKLKSQEDLAAQEKEEKKQEKAAKNQASHGNGQAAHGNGQKHSSAFDQPEECIDGGGANVKPPPQTLTDTSP